MLSGKGEKIIKYKGIYEEEEATKGRIRVLMYVIEDLEEMRIRTSIRKAHGRKEWGEIVRKDLVLQGA